MVNMNKFRDPAVYALHAGDYRFRYVGSTGVNSHNRLSEHISRARANHPAPVYGWMREVGVENVYVVDLEKIADVALMHECETKWILTLLSGGHGLLNRVSPDGNGNALREYVTITHPTMRGKPTWIKGKHGAAAGWTDERRANLRKSRVPNHGTNSEYANHGCRCDACIAAHAELLHPRTRVMKHGRYLYKRDKCRCEICVAANRAYAHDRKAKLGHY